MENSNLYSGFMAITRLYLKITESTDNVIDEDEIELFIGSMDKNKLELLLDKNDSIIK